MKHSGIPLELCPTLEQISNYIASQRSLRGTNVNCEMLREALRGKWINQVALEEISDDSVFFFGTPVDEFGSGLPHNPFFLGCATKGSLRMYYKAMEVYNNQVSTILIYITTGCGTRRCHLQDKRLSFST